MIKFIARKIMITKRKTLTYTETMRMQDEKPTNLDLIFSLHNVIVQEAIALHDWKGSYKVIEYTDHVETQIGVVNGVITLTSCKELIRYIEREINIEWFNTVKEMGLTNQKKK